MSATVPRVAESIEDLRVGQIVAWREPSTGEWDCARFDPDEWSWTGTEVILEEAPPVPVPAEAVERLRTASIDGWSVIGRKGAVTTVSESVRELHAAARAILDAIDGAGE